MPLSWGLPLWGSTVRHWYLSTACMFAIGLSLLIAKDARDAWRPARALGGLGSFLWVGSLFTVLQLAYQAWWALLPQTRPPCAIIYTTRIDSAMFFYLLSPAAEEHVFRVYLHATRGPNQKSGWFYVLASALIFTSYHTWLPDLWAHFDIALVGALLAWLYWRTRSALLCTAFHSLVNISAAATEWGLHILYERPWCQ